ncbi:MAG TPA: CRISPR system precrRNA processing endoribonuclease RAMP protein Cas6 [Candidatus Aminicenantes bacterium]|nr:MAG: CRISPR-associated protein Cas6 [Candidatus Aminicenantes bacterium]HEK86292.1 CRISPR system precrRNA processing endoribonuclease RAMP protein Cas6 [Candidatus Aminicenantes bacterium]
MRLEFQKYTIFLKPKKTILLPPYKGSTFRGGFGNSLKRVVCLFRNKNCQECPLNGECVYAYVFETMSLSKNPLFILDNHAVVPHPFIIEPPLERTTVYEPGSQISFNLVLIGRAVKYVLYFIMAFEQLGEVGIGKGRGKFEISKVEVDGQVIYSDADRALVPAESKIFEVPEEFIISDGHDETIGIEFLTPTRIKYQRQYISKIDFFILITNLMRRLALLNVYHGSAEVPRWNHKLIIEEAKKVKIIEDTTSWLDWQRYSHRQKTKMMLGGVIGGIKYEGKIKDFYPILRAGEIFHVGKGISFGLGMYRLLM